MTHTLDSLNARFAVTGGVRFSETSPGLPVVEINTPQASARIALQGAHVLAWQPTGHKPVIWVSKAAVFEPGVPIRGGVPVCWPWFGAVPGKSTHGFVRTQLWEVHSVSLDEVGQVVLRLGIGGDASTRALWDHAFDLALVVTVGQTLTMELVTRNSGPAPFTIAQALHTYFCVGDIAQTSVQGLDGCHYLDKVQGMAEKQQSGTVRIQSETDRIYVNTAADCLIEDAAWGRTIRIAKRGSHSTVVWNPWAEREKSIADMAAGEYLGMLCVETCNAGPDQVTLPPGGTHTLTACISVG